MKNVILLIIVFSLFSCGISDEEKEKKAKEITVAEGEVYCACINDPANESKHPNYCYEESSLSLSKKLDELELNEEMASKAEKHFKLLKDKCEVEKDGAMSPEMQKAMDEYNQVK